jgi:tetratricopeptide (TPR) repeat protein
MTYHGLGWLSATMDNYIDAAELFQKALLIRENALGADPIDTAETRHRLGWVYVYQGKYEEADALLKRALEAFEAKPDSWSVTKAAPYVTMGWLYLSWGRYDEALDYVLKGRAIEDSHGASNTVVTASLHNLGRIYLRLNRLSDADREFQRTLELRINLHGPNHLEVAKTLTDVGELRVAQSRLNEAEDCFTEAAAKLRANGIESPRRHANISAGRAELRLKQQQPAEAESLARSMLETFESGHPWRARIQWLLARALMAQGMSPERESEAKELLHDAIATLQRKVAPEHVWLDGARRTLRELERSGTPNPL